MTAQQYIEARRDALRKTTVCPECGGRKFDVAGVIQSGRVMFLVTCKRCLYSQEVK